MVMYVEWNLAHKQCSGSKLALLTLGTHAQGGLQYLVCLSVSLSVDTYSGTTDHVMAHVWTYNCLPPSPSLLSSRSESQMKSLWDSHVAVSRVVFDHSEPEQPSDYTTSVHACLLGWVHNIMLLCPAVPHCCVAMMESISIFAAQRDKAMQHNCEPGLCVCECVCECVCQLLHYCIVVAFILRVYVLRPREQG